MSLTWKAYPYKQERRKKDKKPLMEFKQKKWEMVEEELYQEVDHA